jgi:HlyD family secretion protein
MDIKREGAARSRKIRRIIYGSSAILFIALTSVALSRLKPAAPGVDAGTLWREPVKRGPMKIEVRGLGTLVPEDILWIPAVTDGRVVKRLLPGVPVKADTVLVVLRNPQLEQQTLSAEWQIKKAEADYNSLKSQLDSQVLDQKGTAATVKSGYLEAKLQADRDEQLAKLGLGPELTAQLSEANAQAQETRNKIEDDRVGVLTKSVAAQLAASQATIEQLRAQYDLDKSQLDALSVRAGADGVLQEVPVEVGQQVTAGTILAKVAQPTHLKAQLKIAETQASTVQLGQLAEIDTHNGIIPGHVIRIDPSVQNGTRTVDVKLDGALPAGAVPDLSVDGTIEIEDLKDVVYVGRPAFGQPDSTISLFKVVNDGKEAVRVQVKIGKASVNTVEVLSGLNVGDEVILSDMSRWDGFDRVRLQ